MAPAQETSKMTRVYRVILGTLIVAAVLIAGCAQDKRNTVSTSDRQEQGEVHETDPGSMTVD